MTIQTVFYTKFVQTFRLGFPIKISLKNIACYNNEHTVNTSTLASVFSIIFDRTSITIITKLAWGEVS